MRTHGRPILTRSLATTLATLALCGAAHATDGTWIHLDGGDASGIWGDPANWLDGQVADGADAIADFSTLELGTTSLINMSSRVIGTLRFGVGQNNGGNWRLGNLEFFPPRLILDVTSGPAMIQILNGTVTMDAEVRGNDGFDLGSGGGPGGRLILKQESNFFSGGVTISGGVLQIDNRQVFPSSNTVTVSGTSVESRLEVNAVLADNAVVIADGVTPGAGRGAIESGIGTQGLVTGQITIEGSTGNGGHFSSVGGSELFLTGFIDSSVPVVQMGGIVNYDGRGNYTELEITGVGKYRRPFIFGIDPVPTVSLGTAGRGDGTLEVVLHKPIAGLRFGRTGSTDRGVVKGSGVDLTGNIHSEGDATHMISSSINLDRYPVTFEIEDGINEIDLVISEAIFGFADVTKTGTGTLELTSWISNEGTFAVEEGTLAGNPSFLSGPLTVASGAGLVPGTRNTAGSISAPSISFGAGTTTVQLNVGIGGDAIIALNENGLRNDGVTTLNLSTFGGPLEIGTYDLIHYSGTIQGAGFGGFQTTLPARVSGALVDTGSAVALNVTGTDAVFWTGAIDQMWNLDATANWKLESSGASAEFLEGDDVIFDDTAGTTSVILNTSVAPSRTTFNNSAAAPYVIAGSGGLEGAMALRKTGEGTVTLRTSNGYAGKTTISAGTLEVDYPQGSIEGSSEVAVAEGATLKLTSANADFAFDRPISGSGTVIVDPNAGGIPGSRTVSFSGSSSLFSGRLILSPLSGNGSFRLEVVSPSRIGSAEIVVHPGAQLQLRGGIFPNSIQISGSGYVDPAIGVPHPGAGLGAIGASGALSFSGGAILSGPIFIVGNTLITAPNTYATISGDITSAQPDAQLVIGGWRFTTLTLTGTNSYGPTWINPSSILRIGQGGTMGTLGTGDVTLLGEANSLTRLEFARSDGYALENNITSIENPARTEVNIDVRGTGFSDQGHTINLGSPLEGGIIRIESIPPNPRTTIPRATISGSLSAGEVVVSSFEGGAALEFSPGANVSIGSLNASPSSAVRQTGGDITVAKRIALFGDGGYRLDGGKLTLTADAGTRFPAPYSFSGEDGGIYAGEAGTGSPGAGGVTQTGGILTTNWIVGSYTLNGGLLVLKSDFGLITRSQSAAISLNGGAIQAANSANPSFDSPNITVGADVTLDANGGSTFSLYGSLGGTGLVTLVGDGSLETRDISGFGRPDEYPTGGSLRGVSVGLSAGSSLVADRMGTDIWTGALGGAGTLQKQNTGRLFMTGNGSGFSGLTVVVSGRLDVPVDFASPSIAVADGAALGGESTTPNVTLGNAVGSGLFIDGSTAAALTVANLTVNGLNTVDFSAPPTSPGAVTALNYGAKTGGGTFALAGAANYRAATVTDTGSSITVDVITKNLRWTAAVNSTWNHQATANFADNNGNLETFFTGDSVIFDGTGVISAITLAGYLSPWRVVVASITPFRVRQSPGRARL
ncbi:MAG: autotransporter-associated beta strand repeat-containing protein [Chthoniobacteraceae bacterium]